MVELEKFAMVMSDFMRRSAIPYESTDEKIVDALRDCGIWQPNVDEETPEFKVIRDLQKKRVI